jgi:hypothetical protein
MATSRVAKLTKSPQSFRTALEFYYQPTEPTWEQTAEYCGISSVTLREWRLSEQWEITEREVRESQLQGVVGRAAVHAWAKALKDANPQVLLRTLEHLGMIGAEKRDRINEADLDAELARALAVYAGAHQNGAAKATNGVAPNGTSSPAKL